ncbi:MAG TPA: DUF1553 domain-containing protein, partial [Isosphaeraceae bacterium]|nr:DUF1553 domain-containing protein [Isosphaeraceae bacterium]
VEALARSRSLDSALLGRWLAVLKDDSNHLPAPLEALVSESPAEPANSETSVVFERFDGPDYAPWTTTGHAFGTGPTQPGDWRPGERGPIPVEPGVAHSGLVSDRLFGVLRSPTFTLERPYLMFRARGRDGRLNLVVDGFEKIRSPIYGGLTISVNSDDWRWYVMNVTMWTGHRVYIEAGDGATIDYTGGQTRQVPGTGNLALDEVRFSDDSRTPREPHPADRALAENLDARVKGALQSWKSGHRDRPGRVEALGWMAERGLLNVKPEPRMARYREIEAEIPEPTLGLAILDGTPEDEYIFVRGDYRIPGDRVPRRFLEVLGGEAASETEAGSGRLDLAYRLIDPANPLPARVLTNRVWLHLFGRGIVPTPDDFGHMGTPPTHPELLDWLTSEFLRNGWSVKHLIRMLVLSKTYRMSSRLDPAAETADPENRLWHRAPVRRLEAETIRDAMLAVSGQLNPSAFGPSVPPHLTPFMEGRGRPSKSGPLDGDGRRSLYIGVRRNFLTPMLLAFDFPTPASCMGRRNVSNVPAQALTLMNDPFVLDQARLWSRSVLSDPAKTPAQRIDAMYLAAFGRLPEDSERSQALAFLGDAARTGEPGPWTELAHVLFNVKEFIFVY